MQELKILYEKDANPSLLKSKKLAVIGYGSQGHAHSQNLKESGFDVVVGLYPGSKSKAKAEREGLEVLETAEAAKVADVVMLLVPDQFQREIYLKDVEPNLSSGNVLAFGHGFNIHYDQIIPPAEVDVIMIAPKGPGHLVRRTYVEGSGVPCLIAVHRDASGRAADYALAWASGIGGTRSGVIPTSFRDETETDLFGEQAVLCGGVCELIRAGYETLTEAGYPPHIVYFEVLHEMKLIVDLIYEGGMNYMNYSISETAEYGNFTRGSRIIGKETRKAMKKVLTEIQSGDFAKEWLLENRVGQPHFKALRKRSENHSIEKIGAELRKMFSWLDKK